MMENATDAVIEMLRDIMDNLGIDASPRRVLRRVINGATYSTKTASSVESFAYVDYGRTGSDWKDIDEKLYQTKRGLYFLEVEHGASRPFHCLADGGYVRGYALIPLTAAQAHRWAELRGIDLPGRDDDDEGDADKKIIVRLTPILAAAIDERAAAEGKSRQGWVESCLTRCVQSR